MLIAILSNKFAAINQNAQQEVNETLLAPASFSPACSLTFFFVYLLAPFPKSGENGRRGQDRCPLLLLPAYQHSCLCHPCASQLDCLS